MRRVVPGGITHLFLIANVVAMTTSSLLIIVRKHSEYAVAGLLGVVVTQALGYGLIFDLNFFLRNLSVMGGLLMVLSDSWVRKRFAPAGLPQIDEKDRKMYFQLAGRVLLIFLFIGFVFAGEWSFWRVLVILVGAVACIMVAVGFKAKWSAVMLVVILSIFNLLVNNFWTVRRGVTGCEHLGLLLTRLDTVAPTPPTQGLCQVRFLPDPLDCGRTSSTSEHGPRAVQCRREEKGLLSHAIRADSDGERRGIKTWRCEETSSWRGYLAGIYIYEGSQARKLKFMDNRQRRLAVSRSVKAHTTVL